MFAETLLIIKAIKVSTAIIASVLFMNRIAPVYKDEDRVFQAMTSIAMASGFILFIYMHFYFMGL